MDDNFHYGTITEAIKKLRDEGFTVDFNLEENAFLFEDDRIEKEGFEIVDVYRYEGNSNPSDESVVYAIESKTGLKGIILEAYGNNSEERIDLILKKIPKREQ